MVVEREGDGVLQAYLAQVRPRHRRAVQALHDAIAAEVPDAVVAVRRGVPAFRYRGRPLVSIGDAERHVSLYVMQGNALDVHAAELAGYDRSRTVVRFEPESPIPTELVARLARTRLGEIEAMGSIDRASRDPRSST